MKILDRENSKKIITKLVQKFGYSDLDYIDLYLDSNSRQISPNFYLTENAFPFLWAPQGPEMWRPKEIWQEFIPIADHIEDECDYEIYDQKIIGILRDLLQHKYSSEKLYAAGNLSLLGDIERAALEFNLDEFGDVFKYYRNAESYFFPADLTWMICVTHEDLSFIAGRKSLIEDIKARFPEYKKYEPKYWREILGV